MGVTIRNTVLIEGVGLHSGEPCVIRLHPHAAGIWFRRGGTRLPARWDYVRETTRCTMLGEGTVKIMTIEHLMAALWSLDITGCEIEMVRGQEVPILDGSAVQFVEQIEAVGLEPLPEVEPYRLLKPVMVQQGDRIMAVTPGENFAFGCVYLPEPLGVQAGCFALEKFSEEIAPARTWGFKHEVDALRAQGLALGGSLENALILDETGYYNAERFPDEPMRHKILDALGDLYLCGEHLSGFHLTAIKSSHQLGVQLAREVVALGVEKNIWKCGGMDVWK